MSYVYLPIPVVGYVPFGFTRVAVVDLTEHQKTFLAELDKIKQRIDITQLRQHPEVVALVQSYLKEASTNG